MRSIENRYMCCGPVSSCKQGFMSREFGDETPLVAGTWTDSKLIYHGGSFFKLAHKSVYIKNTKDQNRELRLF